MRHLAVLVVIAFMGTPAGAACGPEDAKCSPERTLRDCPSCPTMVVIRAGSFAMGSTEGDADEKPVRTIEVKSFAMGKTEVTQRQWRAVMGSNPSEAKHCGGDCPVDNVSLRDAEAFLAKLSAKTGQRYRLPSEAEWEYACRAGDAATYCGGDDLEKLAWHDGNSGGKPHPVGRKRANAWGLVDMSGNVAEWVQDCWVRYDPAATDAGVHLKSNCISRIVRGGSWGSSTWNLRAADRDGYDAAAPANVIGFRAVRDLAP
jgi:formylglycine-generating enzyme required for sulfatase activity